MLYLSFIGLKVSFFIIAAIIIPCLIFLVDWGKNTFDPTTTLRPIATGMN